MSPSTDDATTLVDQIFYTNQTLTKPETEHNVDLIEDDDLQPGILSGSRSSQSSTLSDTESSISTDPEQARLTLFVDWPSLCKR